MFQFKSISIIGILLSVTLSGFAWGQSEWGGISGKWEDHLKWNNGNVPNSANESALLGGTGSYNVGFKSFISIADLEITNPNAVLTFNTGGTTNTNNYLIVKDDVTNNGLINLNSDNEFLDANLDVEGVFTISNSGTVAFGGSSLFATSDRRLAADEIINNGVVLANQNAELRRGAVSNNGIIHTAAGKTLEIHSPTFNNNGTLTNDGRLEIFSSTFNFLGGVTTGNAVDVNSSILNLSGTGSATFNMYGFNPNTRLSGDIAAAQTINFTPIKDVNGNFTSSSLVHVDSDFTNNGLMNFVAYGTRFVGILGSAELSNSSTGTLRFGGSAGATSLRTITADIANAGFVDVNENSRFNPTGGSFSNDGSIDIATGKTMEIRLSAFNQNGGTLVNNGTFDQAGGTFNFNGGNVTGNAIDLNSAQLNLGAGAGTAEFNVFGFNSNTRVNGDIGVGQTINIKPRVSGSTFVFSDASFNNMGTLNLNSDSTSDVTFQHTGTLSNAGRIAFGGNSTDNSTDRRLHTELNNLSGGIIDVVAQGTGTLIGVNGADHNNSGVIISRHSENVVSFVGSSFTNQVGGSLQGVGRYDFNSSGLNNLGTIAPGLSPGMLIIDGDVTFGTTSRLEMEIGGLSQGIDYDYLDVVQNLVLNGELSVAFFGGFQSQISNADTFTILTSSNLSGSFNGLADGAMVQTSDGYGQFKISYQGNSVVLSNFSANAVPEPVTGGFLFLVATAIMSRRKRK